MSDLIPSYRETQPYQPPIHASPSSSFPTSLGTFPDIDDDVLYGVEPETSSHGFVSYEPGLDSRADALARQQRERYQRMKEQYTNVVLGECFSVSSDL